MRKGRKIELIKGEEAREGELKGKWITIRKRKIKKRRK